MNLLRELKCADGLNQKYFAKHFSDSDLWRMVTIMVRSRWAGKACSGS